MVSTNGSVGSPTSSSKRPKLVEESLRERTPIYYFGLGSNMSRSKLESRSFDGSKIHVMSMEPAVVHNYRLAFNLPGFLPLEPAMGGLERVEGCSDEHDEAENDRGGTPSRPLYPYEKPECHGALILLSADDYEKMMHTEGVSGDRHEDNRGYEEVIVTAVPYDKSKAPVRAVALRPYPLSRLPYDAAPSPRYMKILRDGAAELGLAPCYQEFLAKHPVHTTPIWVQMIAFPNLVTTMTLTFSRSRWMSRVTRLQYKLMYWVYACPTSAYPLRLLSNVAHAVLMVPGSVVGVGMLAYRTLTGRRLSPSVERFLFQVQPAKKA
jgi:hypothetical protein